MKSSTLMAIMVLQAALVMGIFPGMCNSDVHATSLGESQVIDINPGRLGSCANCNFSFSGLYTCKSCAVVNTLSWSSGALTPSSARVNPRARRTDGASSTLICHFCS